MKKETKGGRFARRAGSAFIRVNYGINRRIRRGHFEHQNGTMRVKGSWEDDATHKKIFENILRRHPGWHVTGWCPSPPPNAPREPRREGGAE